MCVLGSAETSIEAFSIPSSENQTSVSSQRCVSVNELIGFYVCQVTLSEAWLVDHWKSLPKMLILTQRFDAGLGGGLGFCISGTF